MVDIRPEVTIYQVFRHINYKKWNAIAEFVDNSIQSYLSGRDQLAPEHKLVIHIDVLKSQDGNFSLKVTDNSFGIAPTDFSRAFRPGNAPSNRSGLSEFGVGMKFAACFFSREWSVTTRPFGFDTSYVLEFDVDKISALHSEDIVPKEFRPAQHPFGTTILMKNIYEPLHSSTVGKIKRHLSGIYRCFIRDHSAEIYVNGDKLDFVEPDILCAKPCWKTDDSDQVEWRRDVSLSMDNGRKVSGFVALRASMSAEQAGLALFRRGRAILGSDDDNYRPKEIFGSIGSFEYKRIYGELHFEGFEVSHTKDSIQWGDTEEAIVYGLKQLLAEEPSLLRQGREYRVGVRRDNDSIRHLEEVTTRSLRKIEHLVKESDDGIGRSLREAISGISSLDYVSDILPADSVGNGDSSGQNKGLAMSPFVFETSDRLWRIFVVLSDCAGTPLFKISQYQDIEECGKIVSSFDVAINKSHPFIEKYATYEIESSDALIVFIIALSISEIMVRADGHPFSGALRRCVNELVALI
jgi:hypothetical protein